MYLLWGRGVPAKPGHAAAGRRAAGLRDAARDRRSAAGPRRRTASRWTARRRSRRRAPTTSRTTGRRPRRRRRSGARRSTAKRSRTCESLGYIGASESDTAPPGSRGSTRTAGSYNNEGVIFKERGKLPQAIEAFEKALAVDPNLASAQWNLSDVLYAMRQDLDRSDELLRAGVRRRHARRRPDADRPGDRVPAQRRHRPQPGADERRRGGQRRRSGVVAVSRPLPGRGAATARAPCSDFDRALALAPENAARLQRVRRRAALRRRSRRRAARVRAGRSSSIRRSRRSASICRRWTADSPGGRRCVCSSPWPQLIVSAAAPAAAQTARDAPRRVAPSAPRSGEPARRTVGEGRDRVQGRHQAGSAARARALRPRPGLHGHEAVRRRGAGLQQLP